MRQSENEPGRSTSLNLHELDREWGYYVPDCMALLCNYNYTKLFSGAYGTHASLDSISKRLRRLFNLSNNYLAASGAQIIIFVNFCKINKKIDKTK